MQGKIAILAALIGFFAAAGADRAEAVEQIRKGVFLVAEPHLNDPNFRETVVLITHHGPTGTTGFIINRPTQTPLSKILPEVKELKERPDTAYVGGPVARELVSMLLRAKERLDATEHVFEDLYFSRSVDVLTRLLTNPGQNGSFRLFVGYSGWAPRQLDGEIRRGDWRVLKVESDVVFQSDPSGIWREMIRRSSQQFIRNRTRPPEALAKGNERKGA